MERELESAPLLSSDDAHLYGRATRKEASLWQCTVNVCQNVMGTGGLALPAVMANGGLGGGLFALLVTAGMASFTLAVVAWLTFVLDGQSLQQLVTTTLGKRAARTVSALVLVFMWGGDVLLLQFVRSNYESLLSGSTAWYADGRFFIAAVAVVVLFPLSLLPNFERLSYFSTLGVLLVLYSFGFVIVEAVVFLSAHPPALTVNTGFEPSLSFFLTFPTIVFAFMTHVSIVPMVSELQRPSLFRVSVVAVVSMCVASSLYILIGVLVYLRVGSAASQFPNILAFYPAHYGPAVAARVCTSVQSTLGYPIGLQVGRITVKSFFVQPWGWLGTILYSVAWIGTTLLVAVLVVDIGYVLIFLGGTAPMAFIFVFPTAMLAKSFSQPGWRKWATRFVCVLFSVCGITAGVVAIVATFIHV